MEQPAGIQNICPNALQGSSAQMFMMLINALFAAKCKLHTKHLYPKDYAPYLQDGDEFDFIVVGSGSSGSVVATRLSEVAQWKVLLIEAGDYPSGMSEIPGKTLSLQDTAEDWSYTMEPSQSYCTGLTDKVCPCPRGKGLGGTSLINAMMYVRSTQSDHTKWFNEGNSGWDYDSVAPFYKKLENVKPDCKGYDYGKDGYLKISRSRIEKAVLKSVPDAFSELGYAEYTEENPIGYQDGLVTVSEGTRQNVAKAYLTKTAHRENLFLLLNAQVSKVFFDEQHTTAKGVQVKLNNRLLNVSARKEVVLSAGSINSPQILMNSGIGPKQHLADLNIKLVRDLPVGENYQDHVVFPGLFFTVNSHDLLAKPPHAEIDALYQYLVHDKGPLMFFGGITTGYVRTNDSSVQVIHLAFTQDAFELVAHLNHFHIPGHSKDVLLNHNKRSGILAIMPMMLNPQSIGYVRLRSADPFESPLIVLNFFGDARNVDMKNIIEAVRACEEIVRTKALSQYSPEFIDMEIPGCQKYDGSDAYWECAVRNFAQTLFHPVGTCKMGVKGNPTAVVDPQLRVHGIKGLRVIDASVMPSVPSGNTNAPCVMIGEKGAAYIKEEWLRQRDEL